jgi:predicted alpha/beta superfamily hydrolase
LIEIREYMRFFQFGHKILLMNVLAGVMLSCQETPLVDPIPAYEILKIDLKILNETRVITIWTPPSYAKSDNSFPVLYMPDGGIGEDFPHIANTISVLIDKGKITPLILVGIENTDRHRDLTGPSTVEAEAEIAPLSDGSSEFRKFIRTELFPEIESRYRVNNKKAIVGESLAGLFIVETFFLEPEMFDIYLAMDPAIYWNDHDLVRKAAERLNSFPDRPVKLWFAGSDAWDIAEYTDKLAEIFKKEAPEQVTWSYLPQPKEHHNTIFRATKEKAFLWGLWK